jgi:hypothetical protein
LGRQLNAALETFPASGAGASMTASGGDGGSDFRGQIPWIESHRDQDWSVLLRGGGAQDTFQIFMRLDAISASAEGFRQLLVVPFRQDVEVRSLRLPTIRS